MRRGRAAFLATLVVIGGCRGLVGISDLTVVDGGGEGSDASVADTSAADTSAADAHDAGSKADGNPPPPPPDSGPSSDDSGCATANPCPPCCHVFYGNTLFDFIDQAAQDGGCICANQPNDCTSECASTVCVGNFNNIPMNCNSCLDGRLVAQECGSTMQTRCGPQCKPPLDCLHVSCGR